MCMHAHATVVIADHVEFVFLAPQLRAAHTCHHSRGSESCGSQVWCQSLACIMLDDSFIEAGSCVSGDKSSSQFHGRVLTRWQQCRGCF